MSRPITLDDLPRLPIVGGATISLDGERLAFTVKRWDLDKDRYLSEIWIGGYGDPSTARALTSGQSADHSPSIDPSGRVLAFVSNRNPEVTDADDPESKRQNLWLINLGGGEAIRLTDLPGDCSSIIWSPDGKQIAFLFQPRDPEPPAIHERTIRVLEEAGEAVPEELREQARRAAEKTRSKKPVPPIVHRITRLHWREDERGILPQGRGQLWTIDVSVLSAEEFYEFSPAALGDDRLRRLTCGAYDHAWPAYSPDGNQICLIANRSADPDRISGEFDLWLVPSDSGATGGGSTDRAKLNDKSEGIAELTRVPAPKGPKSAPSFHPDGTQIAYLAHTNEIDLWGTTNFHVWLAPLPGSPASGKDARDLTPEFDRCANSLVISDMAEIHTETRPLFREGGKEVVFLATEGGSVGLYSVPLAGGEPRPVHVEEMTCGGLAGSKNGDRLALVVTSATEAPEIWTLDGSGPLTRYSRVTKEWRDQITLAEPQRIPVEVAEEGHTIDAWFLKPADFDATQSYPMILQIHGGPAAAYGNALNFEFQLLAANGYCVLYGNPRGSQGYGFEFGAAIRKDLAAPAHRDLMAAVDLVSTRSYVDSDRLAVTGGSWGGYMTNWIVTQTDRFRTAITQRSICDFESDFGTSDFGYEVEWMFGGPPWTHREVYERCSPLTYVENVRTPLLIIHSDEDWRCPPTQAELFFISLKMLRREVEMVRFPNEPHGLSRGGSPTRRLARLQVILDWFERWLKPSGAETKTPASESESETTAI